MSSEKSDKLGLGAQIILELKYWGMVRDVEQEPEVEENVIPEIRERANKTLRGKE